MLLQATREYLKILRYFNVHTTVFLSFFIFVSAKKLQTKNNIEIPISVVVLFYKYLTK